MGRRRRRGWEVAALPALQAKGLGLRSLKHPTRQLIRGSLHCLTAAREAKGRGAWHEQFVFWDTPHLGCQLRHPVLICNIQMVEGALSYKRPCSVGTGPQHNRQKQVRELNTSHSRQPFAGYHDMKPGTEANAAPRLSSSLKLQLPVASREQPSWLGSTTPCFAQDEATYRVFHLRAETKITRTKHYDLGREAAASTILRVMDFGFRASVLLPQLPRMPKVESHFSEN